MQQIIVTTLYLLTIFIPLILSPISYELFEFPKFIILLSGGLVISAAWAYHLFKTKNFNIIPPKYKLISYSVLAYLFSQIISTIFSISPYTSFWGYYTRYHGGLLTTILYTIVYFAAINWLDKKSTQKIIKISVITSILISLYAILEHFGIDKNFWIQDVQNRVFSTLGQPNWLAAYLIPNIFLAMYLSTANSLKKISPASIITFAILFTALLFTKSRSGLIGFLVSLFVYFVLLSHQFSFNSIKKTTITFAILVSMIMLVFGTPITNQLRTYFTRNISQLNDSKQSAPASGTVLENGGTESGSIRQIVWTGAIALIKKYPIFGTGPETFAYTYYWARPAAHNLTSEWDFLYNKAHNEYLNTAATTGFVGLIAYLLFHYYVFATSITYIKESKKINHDEEDRTRAFYPILGATITGFTITNFFGFSVIPVYFMAMIIAALPSTIDKPVEKTDSSDITPFLIIIPLLLIYPIRLFYADYLFSKGKAYLDANQLTTAIPLLEKAIHYRPSLDLYHNYLGESYANLAQITSTSDDEKIKAETQKYIPLALNEVAITKKLNSLHLNDFKSRAKVYLALALIDPKYNNDAAEELKSARILAPTDPKLAYNLGLVYTRLNYLKEAEAEFKSAIDLKPNYQDPYYALTLMYEQTKQTAKLPDLLNQAKTNLATYSSQLKAKIDKYAN